MSRTRTTPLSAADIDVIKARLAQGESQQTLAEEYGINLGRVAELRSALERPSSRS